MKIKSNFYNWVQIFFWRLCYEDKRVKKQNLTSIEKKPFKHLPFNDKNKVFEDFSIQNNHYTHKEQVKLISGKILIEPTYLYGIVGARKILIETVFYTNLLPSIKSYLSFFLRKRKSITIEKVVLFDGGIGNNYFHFYSDIINKIWLYKKLNFKNYVFLIKKELIKKKYYKAAIMQGLLKGIKMKLIDDETFIKVNTILHIRPMPYKFEYWLKTRNLLATPSPKKPNKKIFISRKKESGRYISNFEKIKKHLISHNWQIVYFENKTLKEQIGILQSAKKLISIHGAANTNILFLDKNSSFLELVPINRKSCHYYWLSATLSLKYDLLPCGFLENKGAYPEGGFIVPLDDIIRHLK